MSESPPLTTSPKEVQALTPDSHNLASPQEVAAGHSAKYYPATPEQSRQHGKLPPSSHRLPMVATPKPRGPPTGSSPRRAVPPHLLPQNCTSSRPAHLPPYHPSPASPLIRHPHVKPASNKAPRTKKLSGSFTFTLSFPPLPTKKKGVDIHAQTASPVSQGIPTPFSPAVPASTPAPARGVGAISAVLLPSANLQGGEVSLRGGGDKDDGAAAAGGRRRLGDDERVNRALWFFAGGVGQPPTGQGLREWKRKDEERKQRQKTEKEARRQGGGANWWKLLRGKLSRKKNNAQQQQQQGNAEPGPTGGMGGAEDSDRDEPASGLEPAAHEGMASISEMTPSGESERRTRSRSGD